MRRKPALDAADIRILAAVQKHGQLSKSRLAELVNLSPTPCWERFSRLREAGYIRGFHADLALDRIVDLAQIIVTVALAHHRRADFERFEAHIRQIDEITSCIATSGGVDYVMTVHVASLAAFHDLMEELLDAEIGIDRYVTFIATREVKSDRPDIARLTGRAGGSAGGQAGGPGSARPLGGNREPG